MKANNNDKETRFDTLTDLGLRPVSQVFNQIRYWSALDDPDEEKWDYLSHYTRTERREMGLGVGGFNARPLIVCALILLLLIGVGTGGYLAWPYLSQQFSALGAASGAQMEVVTGYMVRLGSRDLGVVEDRAGMENFVSSWLAQKNAAMVLAQDKEKIKREELKTIGAMNEIGDWLGLKWVRRIEAFDISNISGFDSVGSMVVYEDGRPKRNDYRKFRIKWVKGANDYASMREVLTRRFSHGLEEHEMLREKGVGEEYGSFTRFPDLIMMDGGKGQVNVALEVLEELGLSIPVCGMVKDDSHRTRGLYYQNVEIPIDRHSEGFKLITRIQDEAHRFAIEYHRSLRSKHQVRSILDDIQGIGDTRRKALMRHFKSIEAVKEADVESLSQVPGMNRKAAESVYNYFH